MAIDEQQDWVDRAMTEGVWEPSDGFTGRVVITSMAVLPPPRIRTFSWQGLVAAVIGFRDSLRARIELSAWVLTQYREILFGGSALR
jgi:hypothetical protein